MTRDEIRDLFLATLHRIAPEVDARALKGNVPLRDQVDLDSMDLLNLVIGLSEKLGVDVPEADYTRLATLDQAVSYLYERSASS
jgi:acyl carrier protein